MVVGIRTELIRRIRPALHSLIMGHRSLPVDCRGILGLSGRLGALVVAVIVFANCSGDSAGSTTPGSTVQPLTPSPAAGAGGPPSTAPSAAPVPVSVPTPLPS